MTHSQPTPGFEWKFRHDGWATHQPVLYEAIKRSRSLEPILELGSGFNSTLLINAVAGDKLAVTADHDEQWLSKFRHLESSRRQFHQLNWEEMLRMATMGQNYSVVFIDQGDWQNRYDCIKAFADISEVVILHDSDYLERELNASFGNHYKYFKTFMPLEPYPYMTGPPTTVMSNYVNVKEWNINYEDYK